jgi:hypothetical protein
MTYVGDREKRTQKKEKGFDFFSKKIVNKKWYLHGGQV